MYDVVFEKYNFKMVKVIGNYVGVFLEYDEGNVLGLEKIMKIKVFVDMIKLLIRGMKLVVGRIWKWVMVKYVRLFIFCYIYGILG